MGAHFVKAVKDVSKKQKISIYLKIIILLIMKKGITYSFVVHSASNSVPKQPKTMPHGPRGQS